MFIKPKLDLKMNETCELEGIVSEESGWIVNALKHTAEDIRILVV